MEVSPHILAALDRRITECVELGLQVRATRLRWAADPFDQTLVLVNPARRGRPQGAGGGGPSDLCEGRTTPTLFYVAPAGVSGRPPVVVEQERESLDLVRRWTQEAGAPPPPLEAVQRLGAVTRDHGDGHPAPLVLPDQPWLTRAFLNLVPAVADPESGANCFVLGVPPLLQHRELALSAAELAQVPAPEPIPLEVVEALVTSWAVLEAWAYQRGLLGVPFMNGGRSRLSGQSIPCFHSQFYAIPSDPVPPDFEMLQLRRAAGECPLCAMLGDDGLRAATIGRMAIVVHPAPARDLTLLVIPEYEATSLEELEDTADFAVALQHAVRMYELLLGGLPAYVLGVRTGTLVGHLHAEIVPRSGVNVPAGFEETTGFAVATRDPYQVAAVLRERLGDSA